MDYAALHGSCLLQAGGAAAGHGHGFTVPVMWSFLEVGSHLPDPAVLPVASNGHWMPLTSSWPPASWRPRGRLAGRPGANGGPLHAPGAADLLIGWELWRAVGGAGRRRAGHLRRAAPPLLPDHRQLRRLRGPAARCRLYAAMRAVPAPRAGPWLVASGALAGLATLARIDGLLLAVAPAIAWLVFAAWRAVAPAGAGERPAPLRFLAVLAPWLAARPVATFGSPLPQRRRPHAVDHQLQRAVLHRPPRRPGDYLAWGWGNIIGSKLGSSCDLLGRTAVLLGGTFLVFTSSPGSGSTAAPPGAAAVPRLLGGHVRGHGSGLHLPCAEGRLLPLGARLAAVRPAHGGGRHSRRREIGRPLWPFLGRPQTHRFLAVAGLIGAVVLSVVGSAAMYGQWDASRVQDVAAAGFFEGHRPHDRCGDEQRSRLAVLLSPATRAWRPRSTRTRSSSRSSAPMTFSGSSCSCRSGATRDPLGLLERRGRGGRRWEPRDLPTRCPGLRGAWRPHLPRPSSLANLARELATSTSGARSTVDLRTLPADHGGPCPVLVRDRYPPNVSARKGTSWRDRNAAASVPNASLDRSMAR